MDRAWRLILTLSLAGLFWCVAVGLLLWFLPLGSSLTGSSSGAAPTVSGESFSSISALGAVPLIIPAVLVAIGTWSAHRHRKVVLFVATLLTAVFALLTGLSIGFAYLPAVAALVVASSVAFFASRRPPASGAGSAP